MAKAKRQYSKAKIKLVLDCDEATFLVTCIEQISRRSDGPAQRILSALRSADVFRTNWEIVLIGDGC